MGRIADRNRLAAVEANTRRCGECKQPVYAHPGGVRCRTPYVGEGADGAGRSAQIDIEESHTLDRTNPRADVLLWSAERWSRQAEFLEEVE